MKLQKNLPLWRECQNYYYRDLLQIKKPEQNRISPPSSLSTKAILGLAQEGKMQPKLDICTDIIPRIVFVWPQRLPAEGLQASQGKHPTTSSDVFSHLVSS